MLDRSDLLLASIDVAGSKGLELGPLTKPVVTRDRGDIRYIDHVDTDALRARYSSHQGFDLDAIVPIDYASGDGSIADAVGADAPFGYVVASHVVEHVPDLVRWLGDLRSVLADDGVRRSPCPITDGASTHCARPPWRPTWSRHISEVPPCHRRGRCSTITTRPSRGGG